MAKKCFNSISAVVLLFFTIMVADVLPAHADQPCSDFFKDLLPLVVAKPKPYLTFQITDKNTVKDLLTDHLDQSFEVLRVFPDSQTRFGRFVANMNRKGTAVFFDHRLSGPTAGYSLFSGNLNSGFQGPVIGLNPHLVASTLLQQTLMHEGFHNMGVLWRKEGRNFLYNSELTAKEGARLIEGMPYLKFVSSEEVHTFIKNFIHDSLKAHHRETLQSIENQLKLLPSGMSREQKLQHIKISFDSVIDSQSYEHMGLQSFFMVQQHHSLMKDLEKQLINKSVQFKRAEDGAVKVVSERFEFTANNFKFKEGEIDEKGILDEVISLAASEEKMLMQLEPIHMLIRTAGSRGHFTALEYMKLKDEMAKLSKIVRVNKVP
jgi:hypothetical protein